MIMGNAFAAFPVMAAAIGVPLLIQADGGNAAVVGAVGMLSGFCGTLMTPMAANFNIVPGGAAGAQESVWRHQGAGRNGDPAARRQHPHPLRRGLPTCDELDADARLAHGADRARPCCQGISAQARPCAGKRRRRADPARLHPIFFGSFDWHSCVHGWWTLLTLRRLFPDIDGSRGDRASSPTTASPRRKSPSSSPISTGRQAAGSSGPMAGPGCSSSTSKRRGTPRRWAAATRAAGARLRRAAAATICRCLTYPIRVGTHFNTASRWSCRSNGRSAFDQSLARQIRERARTGSATTATARRGSRAATNSCRRR